MAISKAEFARRRNVSPGRVTQWITAGKIFGPALLGEGRSAQIDEAIAVQQLGEKLDLDQRHANGLTTILDDPAPAPAGAPSMPSLERQIGLQRLEALERQNRRAATDEALRLGDLCETAAVRQQVVQEVARLVSRVEGSLTELASAIAGEFKLPQRDVLHLLRAKWRDIRTSAALEARERAEPMPEAAGFELSDHQ